MTRRAMPLLAGATVVCALSLCPCLAAAQTESSQEVKPSSIPVVPAPAPQIELGQPDAPPPAERLSAEVTKEKDPIFVPTLGQLFSKTIGDFRRLPSLDSAVIIGMGGADPLKTAISLLIGLALAAV